MTEGTHSDRMRQLIETAVAAEIGDTRRLPRAAVDRIYTIYGAFLRVYIEVVRMTENHPPEWKPETLAIDPRVLVDMGHFFSDYQDVVRQFGQVTQHAKHLLTIDPDRHPQRFDAAVATILSEHPETTGSSVMGELIGPSSPPKKR